MSTAAVIQNTLTEEISPLFAALNVDGLRESVRSISCESDSASARDSETTWECHFKWLNELEIVDKNRIMYLKEKMMVWISESTEDHVNVCITITQRLLSSVYEALLGQFAEALKWTEEVDNAIKEAEKAGLEPIENLRVFKYVLNADKLNILYKMMGTKAVEIKENEIKNLLSNLSNIDVSGPCCKAAFLALKGHILNQLGMTDRLVETFRDVVWMAPDFYYWHHQLYTALRKQRRECSLSDGPTESEIEACTKALDLQSDSCWTLLSAAQMYQEVLRSKKQNMTSEERDQKSDLVIQLLEDAYECNSSSITISIRLAEAYLSVTRKRSDAAKKSKDLFKLCESKWPRSSMVLHKIGKFFLTQERNTVTAMKYFKRALEACPENFPCLMDYIKLRQYTDTADTMIALLDMHIPNLHHKKSYCGKLKILKALLLWKMKREVEAVELWLDTFLSDEKSVNSGLRKYFQEVFTGQHYLHQITQFGALNMVLLMDAVSKFKSQNPLLGKELDEFEAFLITIPYEQRSRPRNDSISARSGDRGSVSTSAGFQKTRSSNAEQDNVSNWRNRDCCNRHVPPMDMDAAGDRWPHDKYYEEHPDEQEPSNGNHGFGKPKRHNDQQFYKAPRGNGSQDIRCWTNDRNAQLGQSDQDENWRKP